MSNFTVEYLDPFKQESITETLFRSNQVVEKFHSINWYQNNVDIFHSHNPSDNGSPTSEVIHDYYYFSIEYADSNQIMNTLNIVPNFMSDHSYSQDDVRFSVEYRRPQLVTTSKLAQFFGRPKEKINPEYMSHIKDIMPNETAGLIIAFMEFDKEVLDSKLTINGYLY